MGGANLSLIVRDADVGGVSLTFKVRNDTEVDGVSLSIEVGGVMKMGVESGSPFKL